MSDYNPLGEMEFDDLPPIEVPVKVKQPSGPPKLYLLKEASADVARQYKNATMRAAKLVGGEVVGMDGIADAELLLVSLCLFDARWEGSPDGEGGGRYVQATGNPVGLAKVRAMKYKTVKSMFDKVQEISNLSDKDTIEGLDRQIAGLQKRREKLAETEGETAPKGTPGSTPDSSD
jgi:hypothetical protein